MAGAPAAGPAHVVERGARWEGAQGAVGPWTTVRLQVCGGLSAGPRGTGEDEQGRQPRRQKAGPQPHFREDARCSLAGSRVPTRATWAEGGAGTGDAAGAAGGKPAQLSSPASVFGLRAQGRAARPAARDPERRQAEGRGRVWTFPERCGPGPGHPRARPGLLTRRPFTPVWGCGVCSVSP